MKVKSFAPKFPGFYNSLYKFDDDKNLSYINEIRQEKNLNDIDFDVLDIDYKRFEIDIGKNYCDVIQDKLKDFIVSIEFENIHSPKYYNYSTDSINCTIELNINNIKAFVYENKASFEKFLKENFTSCDGFISHYDNTFEAWQEVTKDFMEYDNNIGFILEFIYNMLNIDDINVYYSVTENLYEMEYLKNIDDILEKESCSHCQKLILSNDIIESVEKYIKIMNKKPSLILCSECLDNME